MKITNSKLMNDTNVERLKRLPESYMSAMETIVDQLDKDWRNKIVTEKYISELLDMFEQAIKEGKKVTDVCGSDIVAFGKKYQEEHDYREVEASTNAKIMNRLIVYNLLLILVPCLKGFHFSIMSVIMLAIGFVAMMAYFYLKTKLYKDAKLNMSFVSIQTLLALAIPYIIPVHSLVIFLGVSASDYLYMLVCGGKHNA